MMCYYNIEDLVNYIENSISTEKKAEISNHLKSCDVCKKSYIALKLTDKFMTKEIAKDQIDNQALYTNLCKHIDVNRYSNNTKYNKLYFVRKTFAKTKVVLCSTISIVLVIALVLTSTIFLNNFSEKTFLPGSEIQDGQQKYHNESSKTNSDVDLPEGYTIDKIKSALVEYINWRLWLYPSIGYNVSDKNFDYYINETVGFEIILHAKSVYARTNIEEWLIVFEDIDGFIYADGQISPDEDIWPDMNNYSVVEKFSIQIQEPQKPNYGKSKRKDIMIELAESKLREYGKDCADEWNNAKIYIADFFEYEMATHARIFKKDNTIFCLPLFFYEENGIMRVQTNKGHTIEDINVMDDFTKHMHNRFISDAVVSFELNFNE